MHELVTFPLLFHRFSAGVAHSFTGSAEDRDKLLSISNMYIGENVIKIAYLKILICLSLFKFTMSSSFSNIVLN